MNLSGNNPDETEADLYTLVKMRISEGEHSHTIAGGQMTESAGAIGSHSHSAEGDVKHAGIEPEARESGNRLEYIDSLKVFIDGDKPENEYTAAILDRLGWTKLGDGHSSHIFVEDGTGAIQLDKLGADFFEGEHFIEFQVEGEGNGGGILYNLYVD